MAIDADGVVHVVWRDHNAEFVYTSLEGEEWTEPRSTSLHRLFRVPGFATPIRSLQAGETRVLQTDSNPTFLSGPEQLSFAFWITPEGLLYSSRAINRDFDILSGWGAIRLLSVSAASFTAAIDAQGTLHVAFYQVSDIPGSPPGIYYTRSTNEGLDWATAKRLYESPYFLTLAEGEANLSLATAGTADAPTVFLAWDNRPRKQVLLARSTDGGASWGEPEQIDGPSPDSGLATPFNVRIGAAGSNAVVVWQSGEPGGSCQQTFRSSSDAGASWSDRQRMMEGLPGCSKANGFVGGLQRGQQGPLYLLTEIQDQSYLSVWNGSRWSEPQPQPILTGFEEPEIFTAISLGCLQAAGFGGRLYVVGCDQGDGGDLWITSRGVSSSGSWFSPQVWTQPVPVSGTQLDVSALALVPSEDGLVHAVLTQPSESEIFYTRWDAGTWSRIVTMSLLPGGEASSPAIAAGPESDLFLIALGSEGGLYYVRAKSADAANAKRWSTPAPLPTLHDGPVSPADVVWEAAGTIDVAYSIPVYENRGVYLVRSQDRGETWTEPTQVFDGAEAGFDLVGTPALLVTANGHIHLLWKRQSIPTEGPSQPLSLYHAWSEDAGRTFSQPELVVEGPVTWHEIIADGEGNLHRLWQRSDAPSTLWDQVSVDGARSWEVPQQLPIDGGRPTVTLDPVGRPHLMGASGGSLGHWLWSGSRWLSQPPLHWTPSFPQEGPLELLASAINADGEFVVMGSTSPIAGDGTARILQYATSRLSLPAGPVATSGESSAPQQSGVVQVQPSPQPAVTPPAEGASLSPSVLPAADPLTPFIVTVLPSALLLLAVIGFVALRAFRGRTR
jgi:hypothetical protein